MAVAQTVDIPEFVRVFNQVTAVVEGDVTPLRTSVGSQFEMDGERFEITDHPMVRLMDAVIGAVTNKKSAIHVGTRIGALIGFLHSGKDVLGELFVIDGPQPMLHQAVIEAAAVARVRKDGTFDAADFKKQLKKRLRVWEENQ